MAVDYSLYLVTDSSKMILADRNLVQVVEAAILGGRDPVIFGVKYPLPNCNRRHHCSISR